MSTTLTGGGNGSGLGLWKLGLIAILVLVFVYVFFVSEAWLRGQLLGEQAAYEEWFGPGIADAAEARADAWFAQWFMASGAVDKTLEWSSLPVGGQLPEGAVATWGGHLMTWWGERVRVFWIMVRQACMRLSVARIWTPLLLLMLVPVVVDAWVERRIKLTNFAASNPRTYELGLRVLTFLPWLAVVLLLAPIALSPAVAPVLVGTAVFGLWVGVTHFAKRT